MKIHPSTIVFCIACLLTPLAASAQDPGSEEAQVFYYRFEEKVYGRLDTSILAIQVPPGVESALIAGDPALRSARTLGDELPYVKSFRQEGIAFVALDEAIDTAELLDLATRVTAATPAARVGHPLFLEDEEEPIIVTDELIVRFKDGVSEDRIADLHRTYKVEVVRQNPHVARQVLLRVTAASGAGALETANRYQESGLAEFAHPNFLVHIEYNHTPTDTNYASQWHLHNTGGGGMTADADVDAEEAWDITRGDNAIVVAVIDGGFEIGHPDLANQYIVNAAEVANGLDDDGNGYVDDINGWSFVNDTGDVSVGLLPYHGQAVAGLVAAEENGTGVVGVCPRCRLLLISNSFDINKLADAFYYARDRGADVITNSWGNTGSKFEQPALITAINDTANGTRGGLGIAIFFASGNGGGSTVAYPARDPNTIAIGGSDCTDTRYTGSQYGVELSVVAPTKQGDGTCGLVTTGLSNSVNSGFGGTSGATPIAAGIAGLMLSAETNLTREQIQQGLQDTADKTEDSAAGYETGSGFSDPVSPTHGWGRVNAFEAVRLVAPAAGGGKDVFLRDNRLDWGNTQQPSNVLLEPTRGFIPHWQSVDVKVDAGPSYQPVPVTAADFDNLTDQDPVSGEDNRVYVRVRNRGLATVSQVDVTLHWAFAGTALPALPANFWTAPPGTASNADWKPLGVRTINDLAYSGASVGECPGRTDPPCGGLSDDAEIVQFVFPGPPLDPTKPSFRHYCVLAVLHSTEDPVSPASTASLVPDWVTPRDNNVTHRNLVLQDAYSGFQFVETFLVRNPTAATITTRVELALPRGWQSEGKGRWTVEGVPLWQTFEMAPGEQVFATVRGVVPELEQPDEVVVRQKTVDSPVPFSGGMTFRFLPSQPPPQGRAWSLHLGVSDPRGVLAPAFDGDLAVTLDLEFPIRPHLSWDLRLGLAQFEGPTDAPDLDVWDLSANLKRYFATSGSWRPFVNGGIGLYLFDPGDLEGGYNAGLGMAFRLDPANQFEAVFNYHGTFTASPDIEYTKLQLGVVRRF